jgi:hypothetical protein
MEPEVKVVAILSLRQRLIRDFKLRDGFGDECRRLIPVSAATAPDERAGGTLPFTALLNTRVHLKELKQSFSRTKR